jgi:hypothetical protein
LAGPEAFSTSRYKQAQRRGSGSRPMHVDGDEGIAFEYERDQTTVQYD